MQNFKEIYKIFMAFRYNFDKIFVFVFGKLSSSPIIIQLTDFKFLFQYFFYLQISHPNYHSTQIFCYPGLGTAFSSFKKIGGEVKIKYLINKQYSILASQ